jgi:hypothetical protein
MGPTVLTTLIDGGRGPPDTTGPSYVHTSTPSAHPEHHFFLLLCRFRPVERPNFTAVPSRGPIKADTQIPPRPNDAPYFYIRFPTLAPSPSTSHSPSETDEPTQSPGVTIIISLVPTIAVSRLTSPSVFPSKFVASFNVQDAKKRVHQPPYQLHQTNLQVPLRY